MVAIPRGRFCVQVILDGWVVVSRLREGRSPAATCRRPNGSRSPADPLPTYGKNRIYLDEMAADTEDWQQVECVQYGQRVVKTIKTFLATWRPAGGVVIRVVLVKEEDGWIAYFATKAETPAVQILEAMADREQPGADE